MGIAGQTDKEAEKRTDRQADTVVTNSRNVVDKFEYLGGVGVSAERGRYDGGVDDAQTLHASHSAHQSHRPHPRTANSLTC